MKENEKIWVVKDGYIVLRNGTIFRLNWNKSGKCVEVKQSVNNCGYLQFSCNGITTVSHRFIAECFITTITEHVLKSLLNLEKTTLNDPKKFCNSPKKGRLLRNGHH